MEYQLKKIKFFDAMSEETPCFTAEIWENGKKVATVKNNGHGGGNLVDHIHGVNTYKDVAKYDNMDVEADIFGLVYDNAETKRFQSKAFVLKKGDKMYTVKFPISITKLKKHKNYAIWKDSQIKRHTKDGYQILNTNL